MPKKKSYLTVTDQFCGAGGSSLGAQQAFPDLEISLALNHWDLAIETHNTNFPDTLHDCTDVSACDPRRYPSTDILITSPECTNHSLAKGKKRNNLNQKELFEAYKKGKLDPAAERSRATMWDVPRFAEFHDYNIIIVENVVDARRWVMWNAWIKAMHLLGYRHRCVYLNSMFCHPTPQSRDRIYVVFWKKGNPEPDLDFRPPAWCSPCQKDVNAVQSWKNPDKKWGKYKFQYIYCCPNCAGEVTPYYYAAFNCIDWSLPGKRIGDRSRPLSPRTIARIEYGLKKYWSQPQVVSTRYTSGVRHRVRDAAGQPLPTQPTETSCAFLTPPALITTNRGQSKAHSGLDPLTTQSQMINHGVVMPFIVEYNRTGKARGVDQPLSTILTSGNHHAVVTDDAMSSFLSYYYGNAQASHISEPAGTFSTNDRMALVNHKNGDIKVADCYYRMIKAHEVKAGMAFPDSYVILGNSKHKVKQCGNAVTPPAMKWIVQQSVESLL